MKLSRISLLVGLTVSAAFSGSVMADDATPVNSIIAGKEKIKQAHSQKQRQDNLYFVRFNQAPIASYQGDVSGYSATNIQVAKHNKTSTGQLNLKSAVSINYGRYLEQQQQRMTTKLGQTVKRSLQPTHQYKVVLNAVALELTAAEAAMIAQDPEVAGVEPVGMHQLHTSSGPAFIGSKQVWDGTSGGVATKGEGVIVGIIDSGINALHPSFAAKGDDGYEHVNPLGEGNYLGDCQTFNKFCNDKLIGVVSYPEIVDYRPSIVEDIYDDIDDKLKVGYDFNGHGSHVASTAAGNIVHNVNYYLAVQDEEGVIAGESDFVFDDISGVAPHANIVSYQVCNYNGSCYPELTILAIEHAIANGVDVLNYSVGGAARDPWTSADSLAFLNAREAGIHVATSAGNSGPEAETIGSPGNSPWITTVAAYTHDRAFTDKQISDFIGGDNAPATLTGKGATDGIQASVVLADSYGDGQCLTPFEAGTFNGEIVVCERGEIARVRKGLNVLEGGAGGLILINVEGGAETVDADSHLLPAIHLSAADGQLVVDWLLSGTGHQATIGGSELTTDADVGDIAGVFTSRGPNLPFPNIFAPDIAAPGVDIYAANAQDRPFVAGAGHIPYVTMSGTSMASPHVAGALALIHAVRPDWTPAEVQSAVMSTAHQTTYKDDDYSGNKLRSDFFDQGAGSIRVSRAVNAGLVLDISKADYVAASPDEGGDPSTLNSTSMVQTECISSCSWQRTVTATQASSWAANYEYLNTGFTLEVSPASFSLAAGETQVLTITATANIDLEQEWVHGYINLVNSDQSMSDTHLQATVGFKAGQIIEETSASLNNLDNTITIKDITTSGTNELQVKGFGLYPSTLHEGSAVGAANDSERASSWLYQDTIFSISTVVKPYTKRLIAEIVGTTAPDMDLYVGIDENGDGLPDATENYYSLICISGAIDSNERCVVETPPTGNYWIYAHNYQGTTDGEADDVTIRLTQITYTNEASFDIEAPTAVAQDEAFDVELTINGYLTDNEQVEALVEGQQYYGLLELGTKSNLKRNVGATLINVTGLAPVEITPNTAPVVASPLTDMSQQLSDSGSASFSVNLEGVFSDAEGDELTLSVTGSELFSITDGVLSGTVTSEQVIELVVTASDGELSVSDSMTITVEAAPVVTPTDPVEPPADTDSGGALGGLWLMLVGLGLARRQRLM